MDILNKLLNGFMENFELILTALVFICFIFYIIDSKSYLKERKRLEKAFASGHETNEDREIYRLRLAEVLRKKTHNKLPKSFSDAQNKLTNQEKLNKEERAWLRLPVYPQEKFIEFFSGMFWILLIIWFVRSFLFEPFRIPSGSMEPNLYAGDFILTSKYDYGVKLPVTGTTIIPIGQPKRGDVVVFRYPKNPKLNYIKRIIGLPNDKITIQNGAVWINGEPQNLTDTGIRIDKGTIKETVIVHEQLGELKHTAQFYPRIPQTGRMELIVPENQYFVMGDNRDGSEDSRSWGYVPAENLLGKALLIWFNSDCVMLKGRCNRIGQAIK